jgi:hypothetical protein
MSVVLCPLQIVLRPLFLVLGSRFSVLGLHLALEHWLAPHQPANSLDLLIDLRAGARDILECLRLLRLRRQRLTNLARA